MPVAQTETLTLAELVRRLSRFTLAQHAAQERDLVVPTPQQQSAERKKELLRRARELGILNEVEDLPRYELAQRVERFARGEDPDEDIEI